MTEENLILKKEKILFFIFDLGYGGAEKVLVQLVNALPPDKYDITVQTIFNVGVNKDSLKPHIHKKWLFKRQFHGMKYLVRFFTPRILHELLVREKYDYEIAYLEGIPTRVISGCKAKETKRLAWVHTEMIEKDSILSCYRSSKEARKCYESFDKIAFISQVALSAFISKTGWNNLKTDVVHNTIDIKRILLLAKESIGFSLRSDVINLCSVGKLVEVKGYLRLMKVLIDIYNQGITNWHFYLLGEGNLRYKIKEVLDLGGVSDHVSILGYDSNPYKYVSKMDFFVCSSYREGYSTAVTESIVVGTPVITTDCSGMYEILGDDGGIIVENTDDALREGLIKILNEPFLRQKYNQGAINRSVLFSTERTIKEFEDFIHS